MKTGLIAGSFDPMTLGHEDLFKQGAAIVDKLIILISINKDKKTLLEANDRLKMINKFITENNLTNIVVDFNENEYTVKYAERHQVDYLIRGLRNNQDLTYEENVRMMNLSLNPNIKTIYLPASKGFDQISSSLVKSLIGFEGWEMEVRKYVSPSVLTMLMIEKNKELITKFWYWDGVKPFTDSTSSDTVYLESKNKIDGDLIDKWLDIILNKYSEPHRMYHNLEHLKMMLNKMNQVLKFDKNTKIQEHKLDYLALKYSIFFHDIIYNPQSKTNEIDSANLFKEFSEEIKLKPEISQKVITAIILSQNHLLGSEDKTIQFFIDLDLFILCSAEVSFYSYGEKIRQEYSFVPEEIYKVKRKEFLESIKAYPLKSEWYKNHSRLKDNFKRNFNL